MPFAQWSLIHNASTLAIGSCVAGQICTYNTAVQVECSTLILKSLVEYKFNRLRWDAILHHLCMFLPSALAQCPRFHCVNWWIMNMQVTHIPLTFHFLSRLVSKKYKGFFRFLYLSSWLPAIAYRTTIMCGSICAFRDFWYITVPLTGSLFILDLYWTPWGAYLSYVPGYAKIDSESSSTSSNSDE